MLTTESGNDWECLPPSCRDKGWTWRRVGAWCLSWLLTMGLGSVRPTGLIPTRTSTRPPHPPHSAPCPYRMQDAPSPIRSATFIRGLSEAQLVSLLRAHRRFIGLGSASTGHWPINYAPTRYYRCCLLKLIIQHMGEGGGHILHEEATHQVPAGTSDAG